MIHFFINFVNTRKTKYSQNLISVSFLPTLENIEEGKFLITLFPRVVHFRQNQILYPYMLARLKADGLEMCDKKIGIKTRDSLSLYSWYAWDRGQIPKMLSLDRIANRDMKKKKKKRNAKVDSWYHE